MDQYMTLSKRDFKINITLNELYVTQDYLLKHIDTLVSLSTGLSSPHRSSFDSN